MELLSTDISIDMIDLVLDINVYDFEIQLKRFIDGMESDPRLSYWDSFQWNRYRHNWKWETDDYSFFFSYKSNISQELSTRLRLSYNPNKVDENDTMLNILLHTFKVDRKKVKIQSFDVAFDYYGITTSDLVFDKGRKNEYKIFKYPESDYTYYLGKGGTNGSVKIYDKATEENKGQADYNKTRYEVTIRPNLEIVDVDLWKCTVDLPKLYIKGVMGLYDDKEFTDFEKLLVHGIENGYPIEKLSYRNRVKYNQIAESRNELYTKIEPSQLAIEKALNNFIKYLFN